MCATRLDLYESRPAGQDKYLSLYGWHFSRKMYEWAVSMMKDRQKQIVTPKTKKEVDDLLQRYGITLVNNKGYDAAYVEAMARADFMGSSIVDEFHLAKYIKDSMDDPDGYEGMHLTRFLADTIGSGTPVIWEDML